MLTTNGKEARVMATISSYPVVRHVRATATNHLEHLSRGRVSHSRTGAAFWFRPMTSAISEVPVDDREHQVLVRVRTTDLQEVTVPGTVTYRFADPALAATRVDFSIDLRNGSWIGRPLETVGSIIHGATASAVTAEVVALDLPAVLRLDPGTLEGAVVRRLQSDERLAAVGIHVVGVLFAMSRPDPDVERALQTPARELIQQEADRATFERRALAVEREAAIGENELANQIELARRQERLLEQQGANARRKAQEAAAADAIAAEAQGARTLGLARAQAEADRMAGQVAAETERAHLSAYEGVSREVLMSDALQDLAKALASVDQLVVTPDVLTGVLGRLVAAQPDAGGR